MLSRIYIAGLSGFLIYSVVQQNSRLTAIEGSVEKLSNHVTALNNSILEKRTTQIKYTNKDIDCLARNIYFEARGEDVVGKYAVADVTINRVSTGKWGRTVCSVVYAKKQFSWTIKKNRAWTSLKGEQWENSKAVAAAALINGISVKSLDKALYYHANYVSPYWKDNSKYIAQIGAHVFYTQAKGTAIKF